jgi:Domain of unknown function (DUF1905)
MKFTATISRFEESEVYWTSIIIIPEKICQEMIQLSPSKRVICTINKNHTFHCAMIPKKPFHFIMLNKERIALLKLTINDEILVELVPDLSEYGIDISEELQEVLLSDDEGKFLFEKLTSGKQRSLIYLINKIKNSQSRINKSFVILDHLKRNKGTLDLKLLSEDFKNFNSKSSL